MSGKAGKFVATVHTALLLSIFMLCVINNVKKRLNELKGMIDIDKIEFLLLADVNF